MGTDGVRRAKLFQNGRSQAVRLPVDMRFEGREVRIRRVGDAVILEPFVAPADAAEPEWSPESALPSVDPEFAEMLRVAVEKVKG